MARHPKHQPDAASPADTKTTESPKQLDPPKLIVTPPATQKPDPLAPWVGWSAIIVVPLTIVAILVAVFPDESHKTGLLLLGRKLPQKEQPNGGVTNAPAFSMHPESSESALQSPFMKLTPANLTNEGDQSNYDDFSNTTTYTRYFRVGFTLENVGYTAAVDIFYDISCNDGSEKEVPAVKLDYRLGGLTLKAGDKQDVSGEWRRDLETTPDFARCIVTVNYSDVSQHRHGQQFCIEAEHVPQWKGDAHAFDMCPLSMRLHPSF